VTTRSISSEGTEQQGGIFREEPETAAISELDEDQALALLQRPEVIAETLVSLARNPSTAKRRKVAMVLILHPRTPRHVSLPMLRRLFTFDLMRVTLTPAVAADIKRTAEEQLLNRLESLSLGEKISLARRASGRVAAALLEDSESRIVETALENPRLTEAHVVTVLSRPDSSASLFAVMSAHPKWSLRRDVQIALLRSERTPIDRAIEFAQNFPEELLREIVPEARRSLIQGPSSSAS
jgi:hypothetical protein